MNNREIGRNTELRVAKLLKDAGYYVSYCHPNGGGQQSCDFIAMKDRESYLFDVKHLVNLRRPKAEINQIISFERWIECGGTTPFFLIECNGELYKLEWGKGKVPERLKDVSTIATGDFEII
jgi:Holliday junction resolvase